MEGNYISPDDLVHLVRLAVSGSQQDVVAYTQKIARKVARFDPVVAQTLVTTVSSAPARNAVLRSQSLEPLPVDMDSRLELARVDESIHFDNEPIWQQPVKARLEQIVVEREKFEELASANVNPTRSVLFTGAPGVGKSMAAKWLARSLELPLVTVDLAAVMSSFLGRTGNNIRNILDYAKSVNCVLFLDELDALAKRRDDATEVGELKRLVTVLLQEIDGWPADGLMLAATNHPDLLDPAVWRRFDMIVEFPLPDTASIEQALRNGLERPNELADEIYDALSIVLAGTSFSDLHRMISQLRRKEIVSGSQINDGLLAIVKERIGSLAKSEKVRLAQKFLDAGMSQRSVNSLTGLSRDTIRRHCDATG